MDNMLKMNDIFPEDNQIPEQYRIDFTEQHQYLINGEIHTWEGPQQEVYSPICKKETGKPRLIGSYPLLTEKEALEALDAAVRAYNNGSGEWPTMAVSDRIRCIEEFVFRMQTHKKEITNLLMWEICKTVKDSEKEFDRTVEYIKSTIDALKELDRTSSRFTIEKGIIAQIRRAPLGVVLCMGPFNYPLNETFTTLIPALIMGNTVIFKPAKYGVLLFKPLINAFKESFPPGVVNTLYGDGKVIITPVMSKGLIDVLAFIGSSKVANIIEKVHPKPNRLRSIYGLEAKNPGIILQDADIELTVKECLLGTLSYNGQRCTALKILFVHKNTLNNFLSQFCDAVSSLVPGMPWEEGVHITPLPETGKTAYFSDIIKDAASYGAEVINTSGGLYNETIFFPAVLSPVNENMRIYHEEQFGPVIPIVPFDDLKMPIAYIEKSPYGQQASIFGKDPESIARLIDPLVNQVCRLNINSQCQRGPDTFPFTGRKDSAEGTLSVSDALKVFSIRTLVAAGDIPVNKEVITHIVRERSSNFLSTDFIL
jgi:glyceraldehyde-3-phosphate dehydrogenase (NADP+)